MDRDLASICISLERGSTLFCRAIYSILGWFISRKLYQCSLLLPDTWIVLILPFRDPWIFAPAGQMTGKVSSRTITSFYSRNRVCGQKHCLNPSSLLLKALVLSHGCILKSPGELQEAPSGPAEGAWIKMENQRDAEPASLAGCLGLPGEERPLASCLN